MRVLVTGSRGFVGRHLVRDLEAAGHTVTGLTHHSDTSPGPAITCDIVEAESMSRIVRDARPEGCIHLAAMAFVPASWNRPQQAFAINVGGTLNVLDALRSHVPACRTLVVSTAQIYGNHPRPRPLAESDATLPDHPYGASKLAADLMTLMYARHHQLPALTARPCNHLGPGQPPDYVVPSFAAQVAGIAAGHTEPVMKVGNLESEREFLDVRDVVRAYRLLLERGRPGEAYNVASGRFVKMSEILDRLCRLAGVKPRIEVDPARFRPTDVQPRLDASKLQRDTGWEPAIPLEQSLADILGAASAASRGN
jgi:GDP-4-dehydro-6-deoxy-D-mannose reductase